MSTSVSVFSNPSRTSGTTSVPPASRTPPSSSSRLEARISFMRWGFPAQTDARGTRAS